MKTNNLAVIPARSGSKGLPDKNIKVLEGKPLLAYSIDAAIESGCFSKIMVSTDSEKYATISIQWGAEVPFLRSRYNASDYAGSWDAVKEVLQRYKELGAVFDTVCLLQPTSPLRMADDIIAAYGQFENMAATSVVSVCECEHSPLLSNTLNANLSMEGFLPKGGEKRRQDCDKYYRLNGAIYIVRSEDVLNDSIDISGHRSYAYIMPVERSVDIDSIRDFEYARFLMRRAHE